MISGQKTTYFSCFVRAWSSADHDNDKLMSKLSIKPSYSEVNIRAKNNEDNIHKAFIDKKILTLPLSNKQLIRQKNM